MGGLRRPVCYKKIAVMSAIYRAVLAPLIERFQQVMGTKGRPKPAANGLGLALGGGFARGFAHLEIGRAHV